MNDHRRTRAHALTASALALCLAAVVSGCSRPTTAPATPSAPGPLPTGTPTLHPYEVPAASLPPANSTPDGAGDRADDGNAVRNDPRLHPVDELVGDMTGPSQDPRQLFLADQPAGTGPEIALRFLQALQDRDDFVAAGELYIAGRTLLGQHDTAFLHQVMRDVAANARLHDAGRCTTAERLTTETAVVRCGQQNVVVHVLDGPYGSGVQISDRHPTVDAYAGPHSHAFTTIEP